MTMQTRPKPAPAEPAARPDLRLLESRRRAAQLHLLTYIVGNALFWTLWAAISVSADHWYWWPVVPVAGWALVLAGHLWHAYRAPQLTKSERRRALGDLSGEPFISLTTFKRDGTPVSTPVWVAGDDGRLLVHSAADTWKVKRIRRDSHVRVAACSATGKLRGAAFDAEATIVADTSLVEELEARKYGLIYRVIGLFRAISRGLRRQPVPESVTIEIVPAPALARRPDGPNAQ